MPKKPRIPRTASVLGKPTKINMTLADAYHEKMGEIAVDCGYGSKTEVVRQAIQLLHGAVQAAKAGQRFGVMSSDGRFTPHYGSVFELIERCAKIPRIN